VDVECATILVAESEIGEEKMKTLAKDSFTRVLNEKELFVEDAGGELAERWPNPPARDILQYKARITALEEQALTLKLSLAEYRKVHHRFISTFNRDKLLKVGPSDIKITEEGNVTAHGGDAVPLEGADETMTDFTVLGQRKLQSKNLLLESSNPGLVLDISLEPGDSTNVPLECRQTGPEVKPAAIANGQFSTGIFNE
jgi:hypothetical protein